ncbi:macro domain-containing protein CT2219 [Folsomia candida]|uniref:O-acetyl-ADP-ribose deacetylase MACROD2 n=1 Tax=Folsomia candida TaxID=158441 RepID=A0A226E9H0_FOLCA|nr:macro domain-containing protein CT2219 [Folsomia candida]OXA53754.1 O-acetyl-ADP-ribose deacetylase MACROD2 [Folsomia candida]
MLASAVLETIKKVKDKFLSMDLSSKRKLYACKEDFLTLSRIPSWADYVAEKGLVSEVSEEQDEKAFSHDSEINSKVSLWQGDITRLEIDCIVNAANQSLLGGGGVDGCIHAAAGEDLLLECESLNGCETGQAKITGGYKLPAKYVIHTVGPQCQDWKLLKSAYSSTLKLMKENNIKTIAFPSISTGIYGYPIEHASHVALKTVRDFVKQNKEHVDRVIFTVFSDADREVYEKNMFAYFPTEQEK